MKKPNQPRRIKDPQRRFIQTELILLHFPRPVCIHKDIILANPLILTHETESRPEHVISHNMAGSSAMYSPHSSASGNTRLISSGSSRVKRYSDTPAGFCISLSAYSAAVLFLLSRRSIKPIEGLSLYVFSFSSARERQRFIFSAASGINCPVFRSEAASATTTAAT